MKPSKSDAQIQQEVLQELKWDSRVDESEIGVSVSDGVVTLTGTLGNYAKKLAAQEAAHRVAGVLDVANDIQVRVFESVNPSDTEIAQAVRRALEWDVWVPDERIQS
ncbi:MAG TPA: BON domain-containing protein, partial [Blastocatellia bacterium]